ncbi:MAG: hypothetical protein NT141_04550 [candidate division WWE3 bacterium]|nr:hypothetical protein [candidate division WWE3 bacterium]
MFIDRLKELFKLTGIPVLIASLCCLAPIILVAAGISTLSFAISLTNLLDGTYRWVFMLAGVISLIVSLIIYFRRRGICTVSQVLRQRNEIINKTILSILVSIILYYLFFYVFLGAIGRGLKIWK